MSVGWALFVTSQHLLCALTPSDLLNADVTPASFGMRPLLGVKVIIVFDL